MSDVRMRILLINKFLRPVGGTETVMFHEWSLIEKAGHTIIPFGLAHPDNISSPYAPFWPDAPDYGQPSPRAALALVWNTAASRYLARLLRSVRPDVAHLHNVYHQLSPSLIRVLHNAGIPTLVSVHDYKLVCPSYRLYAGGEPCNRCVGSHPFHAVGLRCHKRSAVASAIVAVETMVHRLAKAYGPVDRFLVPSRFVRQTLIAGGFAKEKIDLLHHPVPVESSASAPLPPGLPAHQNLTRAFLFAGRLEEEKGVRVLLQAAQRIPAIPVLIAGDGTLRDEINAAALANVHVLGRLAPEMLAALRQHVRGEVVPSLWPEPFGMSAAEAMGAGLAVVVTDRGALPELVVDRHTGLLVPAGNPRALARAMKTLDEDQHLAQTLGKAAREQVRRSHDPQRHLAELLALYEQAQEERV